MTARYRADYEKIPLLPGESFAYREFLLPRFDTPWHFHPEVELTLILSSTGQRFVGDSIEPFKPGDLVLLGSNLSHYWCNTPGAPGDGEEAHSLVIQFQEEFLGNGFLAAPELHPVATLLERASRGVVFLGDTRDRATGMITAMQKTQGLERVTLLLELLATLARSDEDRLLASPGYVPSLDPRAGDRINRCYDYVLSHLSEPVRLGEAAAAAGMSRVGFCRYFKKVMGRPFSTFVNEIRVGQACRLLMETDQSVSEIAFAVGYGSLTNFNRRFRELRKMSPTAYRRSHAP